MNKSKNILITGASTGIGYDLAKVFIGSGYTVFGSVRNQSDAARLREELGAGFQALVFDVTNHKAVDEAVVKLSEKIGSEGLGGLINNAGIAVGGPFMDVDIEEFRYQFEVNVIGLVKVTQAFLPLLGARDVHGSLPGKIIQISSIAGKVAMPFLSPYVGSKHAVEGISQSLRRELQLYGIDVVIIGPGAIKTPIWNKGASEEQSDKFSSSPFFKSLGIFQQEFVGRAIKNAWTAEKLAKKILTVFEKPRSKTRYSFVPQAFQNAFLPGLLPARTLDRVIKKNLKLYKK
ncbi:MAG: SDR family NAD(P)-dependent oxidoreductase [Cyclobacteriaceae bacterium]